jgi:hypothetical protein
VTALSATIMAVPQRLGLALGLQARLWQQALALGGRVSLRPLWIDQERRGCWWNAERAWRSGVAGRARWHLVLQDDVLLCRDFLAGALAALDAVERRVGARPVTFYLNRRVAELARQRGLSWASSRSFLNAQALALPRSWIQPWLRWCAAHVPAAWPHDDCRLSIWLQLQRIPVLATCPSLVDHAVWVRSALGHSAAPGGRPRVARWFLGQQRSALAIDWERGLDEPVHDPSGDLGSYRGAWHRCQEGCALCPP